MQLFSRQEKSPRPSLSSHTFGCLVILANLYWTDRVFPTPNNGWMKSEISCDCISAMLYPYLVGEVVKYSIVVRRWARDPFKRAIQVSELCCKLGIIPVSLYSNATRILQPADVSIFRPLKSNWKASGSMVRGIRITQTRL